jgi:hypothetical protein
VPSKEVDERRIARARKQIVFPLKDALRSALKVASEDDMTLIMVVGPDRVMAEPRWLSKEQVALLLTDPPDEKESRRLLSMIVGSLKRLKREKKSSER